MKVEDLRAKGAGWQIQPHEKGGKQHAMPCHHALAEALRAYIDAAGIAEDRKGWLFRTSPGHNAAALTEQPMDQADAWRMIRRRAAAAGIFAPIGNHTFRATGITAYLCNGGALEHAQSMAAPTRTNSRSPTSICSVSSAPPETAASAPSHPNHAAPPDDDARQNRHVCRVLRHHRTRVARAGNDRVSRPARNLFRSPKSDAGRRVHPPKSGRV